MKISDLFTRQNAEQGKPMEVVTVEGVKTGVHITVLGTESTAFLQAKRTYQRRQLLASQGAKVEDDPILSSEYEYARLISSLVTDWEFEDECTPENVIKFMYESPNLAIQVENFATFMGNKSQEAVDKAKQNSSTGQNKASD